MLLICGEFTPLVVLAVPTIVPYTCRIPKQVDKILKRIETKREETLDELIGEVYAEDPDYILVDPDNQMADKGNDKDKDNTTKVQPTVVTAADLAAWKAKAQELTGEDKEQYEAEIRQCEQMIRDQRERRGEAAEELDERSLREQAQEWVDLARADSEKYPEGTERPELEVFPMTAEEALEQLDPLSEDCEQFNMLDALARTYDISSWMGPAGRERNVHKHMRFLAVDTELLEKDGGVEALENEEVVLACIDRGIDVRGRKAGDLRYALEKWVILTHVLAKDRQDCLRRMAVLGTCPETLWPGIPWPEETKESKSESMEGEEEEKQE